ncbi:hypothetical protein ACIOEX_11180 [Streptomyces sp. NPDC087850]|uniref:hypothetical protein n=1 Tax=Streptomyces sp. NPDC087850 TaxID=3365809 RepID=UPI00380DE628
MNATPAAESQRTERRTAVPSVPDSLGGSQEIARRLIAQVIGWGYTVTDAAYVEELATDATGRPIRCRAFRAECTVRTDPAETGHAVTFRHDYETTVCEDVWTVTVDGRRHEHRMSHQWSIPGQVGSMARAVHAVLGW